MKHLLDTDVVSQYTKATFDLRVDAWLQRTRNGDLYLCDVTSSELWYGVQKLEHGKRRAELEHWIEDDLPVKFSGRILGFNLDVARRYGFLMARARKRGFSPGVMDTLIAATAEVNGMAVATLNRLDFERLGVEVVEF